MDSDRGEKVRRSEIEDEEEDEEGEWSEVRERAKSNKYTSRFKVGCCC